MMGQRNIPVPPKNKKPITLRLSAFSVVGMTRFELATPRPPDAYSNRTEPADNQEIILLLFLSVA